ncbi:Pls/PosA family non-ribosomal peptide synthetase [Prauserella cavernicola]|uniref:Peptide synthetase n=1 Tax=Prauserella cavernicola TaxID=2800127 RepID=A0A934V485_9PSEU|nr:Pls/PosA family non-ribosomal peptide synthetase [Prauserella cavernicola]MBK1783313.1 peptide synthetase [Prauserella cavernicola]
MTVHADEAAITSERLRDELADLLAGVVQVDTVAADSDFFADLGANSLVLAHFCARVRKRADLPSISMKDVYRNPTIAGLASALAAAAPAAAPVAPPAPPEPAAPPRRLAHTLCGTLQLLAFLVYSYLTGVVAGTGYEWIAAGSGLADTYVRSVVVGGIAFAAMCAFPVAAKWILVGRFTPGEFQVWSLAYVRFWLVKTLLHANPMVLFAGNPLYTLYLRALGARIGPGVTILTRSMPVCTDLITIGAGTVVRKESFLLGYRAHAGRIQTGPVTLGRDVFVGEKTVLDIGTSMGDGAQLGHTSALHSGMAVPEGQRWHGSPAQPADVDYVRVPPVRCGRSRRALYSTATLAQLFALYLPLGVGGLYLLLTEVPSLAILLEPGSGDLGSAELYVASLVGSIVLFFGAAVVGIGVVYGLPRLLNLMLEPDRAYPLYGVHYSLHRTVTRLTNVRFFTWLFGDSSYIVGYLRGLGYDLSHVEQTGSNFGTQVRHETPYQVTVGSGTMVADGLSIVNAEYSSSSFRVSRVSIGARNFLGNDIVYPSGGRTGENCLLATKVMVPLDGEPREGVGLLGSPSFVIPRTVERDSRFDHLRVGDSLRERLSAKNRYNLRSMALFLFVRWLHFFGLTLLGLATAAAYDQAGHAIVAVSLALAMVFTTGYYILVERATMLFRRLRPRLCSIYDPYFWWHERLWKVPATHLVLFNGTPFKSVVWRLLGVRLGRRVFDDGAFLTERTLATIGDDCTLNTGSTIQCHSQEDGTFKSDHTALGARCTLGVGAFVHYGVTVGDDAVLAPDSFLMKGEQIPPHARWGGNPATESADVSYQPA